MAHCYRGQTSEDEQSGPCAPGFHLSVPHLLTPWARRGEYWASLSSRHKVAVVVSGSARSKHLQLPSVWQYSRPGRFALIARVQASCVLWCMEVVVRLRALFELNRGENGTGRWLLSLADHSMGTLAALYSPPASPRFAHTLSRAHWSARARWLGTNHLPRRTGAFHSSAVMYGVWLLLATSPHSHKFNTSSYRARSGSYSGTNCFECSECLSARLCTPRAKNYKALELYFEGKSIL